MTKTALAALLGALGAMAGALPAVAQQSSLYGQARGWTTTAEYENGGFIGCGAMISRDGGNWGIFNDVTGGWTLVFEVAGAYGASAVTIDIDRASFPYHQAEGDGEFVYVPVDYNSLSAVSGGNWMTVSFPSGVSGTLSLAGTAAAIRMVDECAQRGGSPRGQAPAPSQPVVENDALRPHATCPNFARFPSPASNAPATIRFTNRADRAVTVYWVDFSGQPQEFAGLMPGETTQLQTYAGHRWVARDFDGTCYGGILEARAGSSAYDLR